MAGISKYVRFGLRADENLADLPDANQALTNILDDLVPGVPFIPADIKVITGLRNTEINLDDLSELGTQLKTFIPQIQVVDPDTGVITFRDGNAEPVVPTVTVKDEITNKKVVLGDPPYALGGSGPNSFVIPTSQFNASAYENTGAYKTPTQMFNLASDEVVKDEDYWIDGRYAFASTLHDSFTTPFGALSFEGYYVVEPTRPLRVEANGYFLIERDPTNTNNWEPVYYVNSGVNPPLPNDPSDPTGKISATITNTSGLADQTEFQVDAVTIRTLAAGMYFSWDNGVDVSKFRIGSLDHEELTVSILPQEGGQSGLDASAATSFTIYCYWDMGEDILNTGNFYLDPIFSGDAQHYRMTVWWPEPGDLGYNPAIVRSYGSLFAIFDNGDSGADDFLPYVYWYKTEQNQDSVPYTYEYFIQNKISERKKKTDFYVENLRPIFIRYTPQTEVNKVVKASSSNLGVSIKLNYLGDYAFRGVTGSEASLTVGDYLVFVGGGNVYYFQVFEKISDVVFVDPAKDKPSTINPGSFIIGNDIDFWPLSSKGLIGIFKNKNGNQTATTAASMTYAASYTDNATQDFLFKDIKADNLFLSLPDPTSSTKRYMRRAVTYEYIDENDNGVFAYTHPIEGTETGELLNNRPFAVYNHKGLSDNSISLQCFGVYGKEMMTYPQANVGQNKLHVTDLEGITVGDAIQYPGFIPQGVNNWTTVSSVHPVPASPTPGSAWDTGELDVNLNPIYKPYILLSANLLANMPKSYTLVFIPVSYIVNAPNGYILTGTNGFGQLAGELEDKSYCILPLNTAPPFLGTATGLSTKPDYPHLIIDYQLYCEGLQLNNATVGQVTNATTATTSSGFKIKDYSTGLYYTMLSV